ncbi:hypothetical protein H312_02451 [Anncaliia algerae PRA339]|uniref:Uncharacterized protein n=1 Tax=Anncaliia algerae PRA339 TaxID=1288291 RepID=A0A059EZJ2_9MICR|nr:hypothetical protein H312_02451 [Anncaliia algerae PRA339]
MFFILFISATRIIKPKGYEDLYLTKKDDRLVLENARIPEFHGQLIYIQNRIVYFEEYNLKYTLGMQSKDISVKLYQSNSKKVSFLNRRQVDYFGIGSKRNTENKNNTNNTETKEEEVKEAKKVPPMVEKFKPPPMSFKQRSLNQNIFKNFPKKEDEDEEIEKVERIERIKKKDTHHYIESDSNLEENEGLLIKNVNIIEINSEYFQLRSDNTCVTLFDDKFIFAPCINSDSQSFTAVKTQEILKKIEIIKQMNFQSNEANLNKNINSVQSNSHKENNLSLNKLSNIIAPPNPFLSKLNISKENMITKSFIPSVMPKESQPEVETKEDKKEEKKHEVTNKSEEYNNNPSDLLDRLKSALEDANLGDF